MTAPRASRLNILTVVVGLVTSAGGLVILWAVGVQFPTTVPRGIIILLVAAVLVAVAPWRWAPGIGVFVALSASLGFVVNGRAPDLIGQQGADVAVGRWIQLLGKVVAASRHCPSPSSAKLRNSSSRHHAMDWSSTAAEPCQVPLRAAK